MGVAFAMATVPIKMSIFDLSTQFDLSTKQSDIILTERSLLKGSIL